MIWIRKRRLVMFAGRRWHDARSIIYRPAEFQKVRHIAIFVTRKINSPNRNIQL